MPKKVNNKQAYEAIYHAIGDAAKKYKATMARANVDSSAAFHYPEYQAMHPAYVKVAIQKQRNVLLPAFRPSMPLPSLNVQKLYFNNSYLKSSLEYGLKFYPNDPSTLKNVKTMEDRKKALFKNVVKACDAAIAELDKSLKHYKDGEKVSMDDVPKKITDIPDKIKKHLAALKKKAASNLKKATAAYAAADKKYKAAMKKK